MNKPVRPPLTEPKEMRFDYEEFVRLGEFALLERADASN